MEPNLKNDTAILDQAFLADGREVASFLVNAMYLFGDQQIHALEGFPAAVAAELTRLGHAVEARRVAPAGAARGKTSRGAARLVRLDRAIGYADRDADLEWLRSMRRDLAPGGLLCFHAWDRDRAWGLSGADTARLGERDYTVERRFDPRDGRVRVNLRGPDGVGATGSGPTGSGPAKPSEKPLGTASVRAYNLAEIEAMLQATGLRLERAYGDWSGGNPEASGARTGRLIIVAGKPRFHRKSKTGGVTKQGRPTRVTSDNSGSTI